jgi:hypothetical protein
MARTKGGRDVFHHALEFEVATRALDEAFHETYGLRLDDLFVSTEAAVLAYRWAFRGLIHEGTGIAWELYRAEIHELDPTMTPAGFVYDLSREDFEKEFGRIVAEPGYFARFVGFLAKLVPDVWPFERSILKPLPPPARARYDAALAHAVVRFRDAVERSTAERLQLPERNLDTAEPVVWGRYQPADEAYAALVEKLAEGDPARVPDALRADVRRFYATRPAAARGDDDERELDAALARVAARARD